MNLFQLDWKIRELEFWVCFWEISFAKNNERTQKIAPLHDNSQAAALSILISTSKTQVFVKVKCHLYCVSSGAGEAVIGGSQSSPSPLHSLPHCVLTSSPNLALQPKVQVEQQPEVSDPATVYILIVFIDFLKPFSTYKTLLLF